MKKTVFISALCLAAGGLLSAQGLYNIMPNDDEATDSSPLSWLVGGNIGWDSNASPQFSEVAGVDTDEVLYLSAFVQANYVNKTPQTTLDLWARVGILYYLDAIDQSGGGAPATRVDSDTYPSFRGGLNFVHRVNERLRLRSRTNVAYEQEPDYDYGVATDRRNGSYFIYSTDNSASYRWTERLATSTGYRLSGVTFDEVDRNDYVRHLFYHQFRYRATPSTVWTAAYRTQFQSNDAYTDSRSHYFVVGAEHELSPTTVMVVRGGAQAQDIDGGDTNWSPYAEATLRTVLSESASLRAFARYGLEDRNRAIATQDGLIPVIGIYEERRVFRIGTQGSYMVSEKLTLFAGANVIYTGYENKVGGMPAAPGSLDETIFNVNAGGSLEVYDNLYVTGSINFTDSSSDADIRDYKRTRVQLGVQSAF
jgi:hypothetical protein